MKSISNWGNTPTVKSNVIPFHTIEQLREIILNSKTAIPRGMGRSYGDSGLGNTIISTTEFNQIKSFDDSKGHIICESGVTLDSIISRILPSGWFLPVSPGTKFVSIGGAVSANVHGKNHHIKGSLSHHIHYIDVMLSDGSIVRASKDNESDLFYNTCGGMGLTGIITEVSMQLIPVESAFIRQKTIQANHLAEIMDYFETYQDWTYSVAWIDCLSKGAKLGRSVLMLGEHAKPTELRKKSLNSPFNINVKGTPQNQQDRIAVKCFEMVKTMFNKEYSELIKLFYGISVSEIQSQTGNSYSSNPEPFNLLSLPIPSKRTVNLHDCFDLYTKVEVMEGDNAWYNDKTKEKESVNMFVHFWMLPEILIVDLKRFNNMSRKNNQLVEFPLENLDLSKYICGYNKESYIYDLYGVCNHMGGTMGGHYTAFVKTADNKWYHFNDTHVNEVTNVKQIITSHAYCFFYRKKN